MAIGNIYVIAGVSVIGGALFGFDISSLSAQLGMQSYLCYFNQGGVNEDGECSGPTSVTQGGITSSMSAGSFLGALVSGFISDHLGRKYSIMVGCVIWVVGSILCCAAQNIPMLIVGRIINGFSVGIESAQVPVYIAEISPPSLRARFIGFQQWAITWGILIMYYISFGSSYLSGSISFRLPWGLQMIPAAALFLLMIPLPESPRWLAKHDRWEDCHAVLTLVHGKGDPDHPFVAYELRDIKENLELERHNTTTYLDLFKPRYINRTMVAVWCQIWSQLCGMNVMMYYIAIVFSMAGYRGNANLVASSITYVINVFATVPALIWGDRVGRRPLILGGFFLMAVWMFANAGILAVHGTIVPNGVGGVRAQSMSVEGPAARGLIACTYLFVATFASTLGPCSWILPTEVTGNLRGKGVSLSTAANWAFNTALGLFVPPAFENIQWRTYIIFGVFNTVALIHAYLLFPETAGKSLETIAEIFEDPNGIPGIGTPAWKTRKATSLTRRAERGDIEAVREKVAQLEAGNHDALEEGDTLPTAPVPAATIAPETKEAKV